MGLEYWFGCHGGLLTCHHFLVSVLLCGKKEDLFVMLELKAQHSLWSERDYRHTEGATAAWARCEASRVVYRLARLLMWALAQFLTQPVVVGCDSHQRNESDCSKCIIAEKVPEGPCAECEKDCGD